MKATEICALIIIALLFGCIYVLTIEMNDINRTQQVEIDFLRAKNVKDKDLFEKRLRLKDDSLTIAYKVIEQAHKESQEARERTQKLIRNYEKIIFIQHTDSSRTAELKTLYKSYTP